MPYNVQGFVQVGGVIRHADNQSQIELQKINKHSKAKLITSRWNKSKIELLKMLTTSSPTCTKPVLATRAYLETFKIKNI